MSRATNRIVRGICQARLVKARADEYAPKPRRQPEAKAIPADLTVYTRFHCQRWHGLCLGLHQGDFQTKRTAAYAAAKAALEQLLRRGVALREIELQADPINADTFLVRLREEGRAAA
jgi:hypothetical protein